MNDGRTIDELYAVIESRKGADPGTSYTAKLFNKGTAKIAQKVGCLLYTSDAADE